MTKERVSWHKTLGVIQSVVREQGERLAPKEGWIKLNTDTGFVVDTGVASAGIV
jgi:hypothetical protein